MGEEENGFDFAEWLGALSHGSTNKRAGERLRECVTAVKESGGKGKLVLTLDISDDGGFVAVKPSIKITKPDRKLPGDNYYATDEGDLVTEDPRQLTMGAKVLAPPRIVKDRGAS